LYSAKKLTYKLRISCIISHEVWRRLYWQKRKKQWCDEKWISSRMNRLI